MNDSSNVTLELPPELKDRRISPTFHTNLVQPYVKNNDILFPKREGNHTMISAIITNKNGSSTKY